MAQRTISYKSTKAACYTGFFVQAIVNNFLPILFIVFQDIYDLSYEKLGRLILVNFVTQLVTDGLTPKIVSVLGYRKSAIICQGGAAFGLVMLSVLPNIMSNTYIAITISILIYAFSSGLMEVILSPMVEMLPTDNKSGNMCILHSFYCWGQAATVLGTTLLISLLKYNGWSFVPLIWAIIPFINIFSFIKVPIVEPDKEEKQSTLTELIKSSQFKVFMVMMLCAGACEIAMAEWASLFAQNALGISKVKGDLAGPCLFAIFMGLGRIIYAKFSKYISFRKTVIASSALCFICYLTAAITSLPILSFISCSLCGLTVSVFWPGTYSAGSAYFPTGASVMFSIFALCGDGGCSLGPWLLGAVADKIGLKSGFAVVSVFPLIMFITALIFMKEKKIVK